MREVTREKLEEPRMEYSVCGLDLFVGITLVHRNLGSFGVRCGRDTNFGGEGVCLLHFLTVVVPKDLDVQYKRKAGFQGHNFSATGKVILRIDDILHSQRLARLKPPFERVKPTAAAEGIFRRRRRCYLTLVIYVIEGSQRTFAKSMK